MAMSSASRSRIATGNEDGDRRDDRDITAVDDGELVRLANKGDPEAWNELLRRFEPMIRRVAKRMGLSESDAADAMQLAWLRLIGSLDQIRDPARIAPWLAITARRESIRLSVTGRRQIPFADPILLAGHDHNCSVGVEASIDFLSGDDGHELRDALDRLPPNYQRLIRLLYSDACPTYAEVSQTMGVPVGSIGPMRQRALTRLRRELERIGRGRAPRPQPQVPSGLPNQTIGRGPYRTVGGYNSTSGQSRAGTSRSA
jgi:RNA polymerase sigma factor (sigma-70 family)